MKILFTLSLWVVIPILANCQSSENILQQHINYLASDELKGRYPGTEGDSLAATYIASQFKLFHLQPIINSNGFQYFSVPVSQKAGTNNSLSIQNKKYLLGEDYAVFPFSSNSHLATSVVFVGTGIETQQAKIERNDYAKADVKDKWVMMFRSYPENAPNVREYREIASDRAKVLMSRDKGAAGVIFINISSTDSSDELISISNRDFSIGIPVIHLKRDIVNKLIGYTNACDSIENQIKRGETVKPFIISNTIEANTEIIKNEVVTRNVLAVINGTDKLLKDEYVVIGAHYDHLGMGGINSSSRQKDTIAIHNGADDNASGVAGMLELARLLSKQKPSRSIVFVAFGAEEMGILGSTFLTEHSPIALNKITSMINLDMIGNLRDSILQITGTGTSKGADSLVKALTQNMAISLRLSPEGYGPSDHAAFYAKNIPVFFLNTGVTATYHTPADDSNLLNYKGMATVVNYTNKLAIHLSTNPLRPVFTEAGPKTRQGGTPRYKVSLGIMPDVTAGSNNGLRVEMVIPSKPAYKAGMKTGDIITTVKGQKILNIEEYMLRLSQLKAGELVEVNVLRGTQYVQLYIQL